VLAGAIRVAAPAARAMALDASAVMFRLAHVRRGVLAV
jgi:hypothetical protein